MSLKEYQKKCFGPVWNCERWQQEAGTKADYHKEQQLKTKWLLDGNFIKGHVKSCDALLMKINKIGTFKFDFVLILCL